MRKDNAMEKCYSCAVHINLRMEIMKNQHHLNITCTTRSIRMSIPFSKETVRFINFHIAEKYAFVNIFVHPK